MIFLAMSVTKKLDHYNAFYFWANEGLEPIHIHVSKGTQTPNATKFWITSDGVELANNNGKISEKELRQIRK